MSFTARMTESREEITFTKWYTELFKRVGYISHWLEVNKGLPYSVIALDLLFDPLALLRHYLVSVCLEDGFHILDAFFIFKEVKTPREISKRKLYVSGVKLSHAKVIRYFHCEKSSDFISILERTDAKDGVFELPTFEVNIEQPKRNRVEELPEYFYKNRMVEFTEIKHLRIVLELEVGKTHDSSHDNIIDEVKAESSEDEVVNHPGLLTAQK